MSHHAALKQQAINLYEKSNQIYTYHRFYSLHQTNLKTEINTLFDSIYRSQNSFQIILLFILKIFCFSPKLIFYNPIKAIKDNVDGMIKDVTNSYYNITNCFLDTFNLIKFVSRFFLFLLIFYAIFLFIFALNTFHVKEVGLLVIVFYLIYKSIKL